MSLSAPGKEFLLFVAKFLLLFLFLYYGTIAIIGLAAPGNNYSPFIEKYLDYVSWIKRTIIAGTRMITGLAGYTTVVEPGYLVRITGGRGVFIAMSCVGYGVYSFWIAYIAANTGKAAKKIAWIIVGLLLLWSINVLRISLFLISINKNKEMPLGIDHHTWFNIFAYGLIFLLMYFYNRSSKAG